jgi:aminoglycoside phosphotransferase (APT) family kinase protein
MASLEGDRLVTVLRRVLNDPGLTLAAQPTRVGRGVESEAWVVQLDTAHSEHRMPLVVRLFHGGDRDAQARYEAAFQNALADQGFPAPRVIGVGAECDGLGGAFTVMERLPGRPLMGLILPLAVVATGAALLDVGWIGALGVTLYLIAATRPALRLHAVPGERILDSLEHAGVPRDRAIAAGWIPLLEQRAATLGLDELNPALAWLRDNLPKDGRLVACHGDYHPGNLMVTWRRLSGVIDWSSATVAASEFDLAWTLIQPCLTAQLPTSLPRRVRLALDEAMRPLIFLGTAPVRWIYRSLRRLDDRRLRVFAALAAIRALLLFAEIRLENPWHNPRTIRLLCRRFERYTGVPVTLPDYVVRGEANEVG